jgi:hypothetical protein
MIGGCTSCESVTCCCLVHGGQASVLLQTMPNDYETYN